MPAAKPRMPLVRRLSVELSSKEHGLLTGVTDVFDYGDGRPIETGNAFLNTPDGASFAGTVRFINGPVIAPHKKNGRPAKTERDIAVLFAAFYYKSIGAKANESVRQDWENSSGIKEVSHVSAAKKRALQALRETNDKGLLLVMGFMTPPMVVFIEDGGAFELIPASGDCPGEVLAIGPRWVWCKGSLEARRVDTFVQIPVVGGSGAYSWPAESTSSSFDCKIFAIR